MRNGKYWPILVLSALTPACAHAIRPASAVVDLQPPYEPLHQGSLDLSTGVYVRTDDDLFINTPMPIILRRTNNSGDGHMRQFGVNGTHNGEWWLYGDGDPRVSWADLILEDGMRIHFHRISPGNSQKDAVLRHDDSRTGFEQALLSWNGSLWVMKLADGSIALFRDCQTREERCSLMERRDAQGHRVKYIRDASQRLLRIESGGQGVSFEYDGQQRIVRASDTSGHAVSYSYDNRGRLIRATSSDGTTRTYGYDDRDHLTDVRAPGRIDRNSYDQSGRLSRHEVRSSDDDDKPYISTSRYVVADGSVIQTDFDEGNGVERHRYSPEGYQLSETLDAEGPSPATFKYDRDARTHATQAATLSCSRLADGALPVPPAVESDDEMKWALAQKHCLSAPANSAPPRAAYRPLHKGYIDASTGLYFREDDDLFLNTAMPVVLRRTYNSGDGYPRQFGMNTTHPGEWWLYGDGDPRIPWGDLILANGGRIHFTRISPGHTQANAVLRHDGTPTEFKGALLSWNGSDWVMKLTDGSLAIFRDCQTKQEHCSLLERRDPQGHRIEYVRDGSQKLLRMASEGLSISFDYDDKERVVRATDASGRVVSYSYDDRGRLVLAASSDGTIRAYGYDDRNNLTVVREPGRIVRNWFDDAGRVVRQEVRDSDEDDEPWIWTARYEVAAGSVVQIDINESGGVPRRERFSRNHYTVAETFDPDGLQPITFTYDRSEATNIVTGVRLSCGAQTQDGGIPVPLAAANHDDAKVEAILRHCVPSRTAR
jgi:YD repeat-containing protein